MPLFLHSPRPRAVVHIVLLLAVLACLSTTSATQTPASIVSRTAFVWPAYEELPVWARRQYTADRYGRFRDDPNFQLERIVYRSGNLNVVGFIHRPRTDPERRPVVVYCRPGVGQDARIGAGTFLNLIEMRRYAEAGFVVIAPQYRGIDGGEGRDEIGGADLQDVIALLPVIRSLEDADPERIFLVGASRGGQMVLQALRDGFPARAAAVVGAPTDWEANMQRNRNMLQIASTSWPDFAGRREAHARERSAIAWVDRLNVPLLVLHGEKDPVVPADLMLAFASRLAAAGKTFGFHLYGRDDHLVTNNLDDRLRRTIEWFADADDRLIVARDYEFASPRRVQSGLNSFRFENRGSEPHYVRIMRVAAGKDARDIEAWRRSHAAPPDWLTGAGGIGTLAPEEMTRFTLRLEPGLYVLLCGHPTPDGVPHVRKGMSTVLEVTSHVSAKREPSANRGIILSDDRIEVTAPFSSAATTVRVVNRGTTNHQALLVRLPSGVRAADEVEWFRNGSRGPRPARPVGGVLDLAPGADAWFDATLQPGRYVLLSTGRRGDGKRDFDVGMMLEFEVT